MRLRYFFLTLGTFLLVVGAIAGLMIGLIRYQPEWYEQSAPPEGPERLKSSQDFHSEFIGMIQAIEYEQEWGAQFTQDQINSYFEEGFKSSNLSAQVLPEDIRDPRVRIEPDRFFLAFRYGQGAWSTVVSLEMRVWLPAAEPNAIALELMAFQVGALPISVQSLLEKVTEVARQNGIALEWYRRNETGNPVALLRFQADRPRPTVQLRSIRFEKGVLLISGRTRELSFNWNEFKSDAVADLSPRETRPIEGLTPLEVSMD